MKYLQILVVGDSDTGKTSLVIQFDQARFCGSTLASTVGIGFIVSILLHIVQCMLFDKYPNSPWF